MEQKEYTPGFLVYAYKEQKSYYYYKLRSLEENDGNAADNIEMFVSSEKLFKVQYPGGIHGGVEFYRNEKGTGGVRYSKNTPPSRLWKNESDRIKWRALVAAAEEHGKALSAIKENTLAAILEPVRQAYRESNSTSTRRLILAEVIRLITR